MVENIFDVSISWSRKELEAKQPDDGQEEMKIEVEISNYLDILVSFE
jgi:hypothetical protein